MDILPIRIKYDGDDPIGLPFVDVEIEGQVFEFLVDTGCARSTMKYQKSSRNDKATLETMGVLGKARYSRVAFKMVRLGNTKYEECIFNQAIDGSLKYNLLGMDVLASQCIEIDYVNQYIKLNAENCYSRYGEIITGNSLIPKIEIDINNFRVKAVLDTGSSITLIHYKSIANVKDVFTAQYDESGIDVTGAEAIGKAGVLKRIGILGNVVNDHKAICLDLSNIQMAEGPQVDCIIGSDIISRARWKFDFPNRRYALDLFDQLNK